MLSSLNELKSYHPRLGTRGFEFPDIGDYKYLTFTKNISIKNLVTHADERADKNILIVPRDFDLPARLSIALQARCKGSIVIIERGCRLYGDISLSAENCLVVLRSGQNHLSRISVSVTSNHQTFYWGKESTSNGVRVVVHGGSVLVGEDCMFASGITIRTSDMHSVMDMTTGAHLNPPNGVLLEPHIWLGQESMVSKGVTIGLGSIVGAKALVNKNVARFCSVGGLPAKLLRSDTTWDRAVPPHPQTLKRLRILADEIDHDLGGIPKGNRLALVSN